MVSEIAQPLSRAQRSAENRERLLAAGRAAFLAHGYHGVSLEQVSRAAGLTKGAVYSQFENKAELFLAVLEQGIEQRLAILREHSGSLQEVGDAFVRGWERSFSDSDGWFPAAIEFRIHAARDPALNERYRRLHERLVDGVASKIGELRPEIRQPRRLARIVLAFGSGLALERASGAPVGKQALDTVFRALLQKESER
jgi:AcrR family transcriptional regulator